MPRQPRLDIPDILHHVIVRGIERRDIFVDDTDKERFVSRLSTLLSKSDTKCYAWALMSNHFHLLLMPTRVSLAETMRRLLTGYAVYFNRKYQRSGHLFQNRYKSILCEEEPYFLELVRYIHLNPLRAGMVTDLEGLDNYPWSGHAVLLGKVTMEGQETVEVLARFGSTRQSSLRGYQQFVADGVATGKRNDLTGGGLKRSQPDCLESSDIAPFDERILGSGSFVEMLTDGASGRGQKKPRFTLAELLNRVSTVTGITVDRMQRTGKERAIARAKALFCCLAVRDYGYSGTEAGKIVGIGSAGASIAVKRGRELLECAPELEDKLTSGSLVD
ncbi:MAG: transposase [Geobacteraceae bacterium]|nr:transposase [Geobacteraceae bacterium]